MIRLRMKELMEERGILKPRISKLVKLGMSHGTARNYLNGKKTELVLAHIEALCLYFRCEPNDLIEWKPDNKQQDDPNQPLQKIKAKPRFSVLKELGNMNLHEIEKQFGKGAAEKK